MTPNGHWSRGQGRNFAVFTLSRLGMVQLDLRDFPRRFFLLQGSRAFRTTSLVELDQISRLSDYFLPRYLDRGSINQS